MKIQAKWDFKKMQRKYKGVKIDIHRRMSLADHPYRPGEKVAYIDGREVKTGYVDAFNPAFVGGHFISEGMSFLIIKRKRGEYHKDTNPIVYRPDLDDVAYPTKAGMAFLWRKIADHLLELGVEKVERANNDLNYALKQKEEKRTAARACRAKAHALDGL